MIAPSPATRRARVAVAALFWLNGATLASLVPRYPELRDQLGLSNAWFGVAVAIGPVGGLLGGFFVARLMRRHASAPVAVGAQLAQVLVACAVLNASAPWAFALALAGLSLADVFTDVAMNAHGLRVQGEYGRSINNGFHAWWSIGAVSGGLLGAWFAGLLLPLSWHAALTGALLVAVNLALRPLLLPGPDPDVIDEAPPAGARVPRRLLGHLVLLGLLGGFAVSVEDGGFTWSALYLRDGLGAGPTVAGMGLVCLVGAQTVGRLAGDRMVDRLGERAVARLGGAVATAGMGAALLFPSVPLTLLGFGCAGWGVATLVPAVYHSAHHLPGLPVGAGLSVVNWLLRVSFLVGPPLVGVLADAVGFRAALAVLPTATAAVLLLAGTLAPRRDVDQVG